MRQHQNTSQRYIAFTKIVLVCFFLAYAAYSLTGGTKSVDITTNTTNDASSKKAAVVHDSRPERGTLGDSEYLWQRPSNGKIRGIVFLGHGCQHSMTDWWPPSVDVCPECIGLPEELEIVRLALETYQLAVVTMSSLDRVASRCWSRPDGPRVAKVMLKVQQDLGGKLPLLAFGASSGGQFVSAILPQAVKDAGGGLNGGFISQIMGAPPSVPDIPAVYITMDRDEYTDKAVNKICEELQANKVPAKHIRLSPLAVDSQYFSERITSVSADQSKKMVAALEAAQMLDEKRMLKDDPRQSKWRSALTDLKGDDTMVADQSSLSEVLNVAWAMHEMSRDGVAAALDFLLSIRN